MQQCQLAMKKYQVKWCWFQSKFKGETLNLQIVAMMLTLKFEIKITVEKQTIIKITGVDKDLVSKIAADIKI